MPRDIRLTRRADAGMAYQLLGSGYGTTSRHLPVPKLMGPTRERLMTGKGRHVRSKPGSPGPAVGVKDAPQVRDLLPPITLRLILRALLGVLLFLCGIVLGAWLIFRFRRHSQDSNA